MDRAGTWHPTRLGPGPDGFAPAVLQASALGANREVVCYKTSYTEDPMYGKDDAQVTGNWRDAPAADPESSLIGTLYESYPANAAYRVASSGSWVFKGTAVPAGTDFANLVGVEYDRVNPGYPVGDDILLVAITEQRSKADIDRLATQ